MSSDAGKSQEAVVVSPRLIDGVELKPLKRNADERGFLMELLRVDDPIFEQFAQVYVSMNYPGVVRAWHAHEKQKDHFACIKGMIKVALYDDREGSPTRGTVNEFFIGDNNPMMIKIPIGVYHGYKTIGAEPALLLNFPTQLYNREQPDELRLPYNSERIPYSWDIKMR
ncbi:MAG: dTDP-4-dehydrorhamnose 3,5-epimerase family protein [Armatimonadetes bacterium]|nr:dTDP-4-dehydrorhamnose 3,5-epimerase family protein [Armatimonadota bacterium]